MHKYILVLCALSLGLTACSKRTHEGKEVVAGYDVQCVNDTCSTILYPQDGEFTGWCRTRDDERNWRPSCDLKVRFKPHSDKYASVDGIVVGTDGSSVSIRWHGSISDIRGYGTLTRLD